MLSLCSNKMDHLTSEPEYWEKIQFKSADGNISSGQILVRNIEKAKRSKAALKSLGILWSLSLVTAVIPILHAVLVPGFFIAGIVISLKIFNTKKEISEVQGQCPVCKKEIRLQDQSYKNHLKTECPHCYNRCLIEFLEV